VLRIDPSRISNRLFRLVSRSLICAVFLVVAAPSIVGDVLADEVAAAGDAADTAKSAPESENVAGSPEPESPAAEPKPLTDEDSAALKAMLEEIRLNTAEIERLAPRMVGANQLTAEVLATRLDRLWLGTLKTAIDFAEAVADRRDAGFVVAPYDAEVTKMLDKLPGAVRESVDRVGSRTARPDSNLPIAEQAAVDEQFFVAVASVIDTYKQLYRGIEVAQRFGLDATDEREFLAERLADGASNVSIWLDMSKAEAQGLRAAVAAVPGDNELKAKLTLADSRVKKVAASLESIVALLGKLNLPAARFKQQLLSATGEITANVLDVDVLTGLLSSWRDLALEILIEQGPRIVFKIFLFVLIIFLFVKLSALVKKGIESAMSASGSNFSRLFKDMVQSISRNIVIGIGVLIALSQLGITLGPLLAGLGIAGFIVGFALQDSLSNFASGMMILFYRPFDVGDTIEAAGVRGKVNHMSLVNTTIRTFDNQSMIIPNNKVWQDVIINVTDQRERRVDMTFGIAYDEDIDRVEKVIMDILVADERVLDEPAAVIKVGSFGDSSVEILVRPWVKTEDYWDVLWDLNKTIKQAFDREGITIPFPQRDVHLFPAQATALPQASGANAAEADLPGEHK
jgi:small conductance mechanosensitive channel